MSTRIVNATVLNVAIESRRNFHRHHRSLAVTRLSVSGVVNVSGNGKRIRKSLLLRLLLLPLWTFGAKSFVVVAIPMVVGAMTVLRNLRNLVPLFPYRLMSSCDRKLIFPLQSYLLLFPNHPLRLPEHLSLPRLPVPPLVSRKGSTKNGSRRRKREVRKRKRRR